MRDRAENAAERRVSAILAICENPKARRQMLWLRAKEKGDKASARDIERVEPSLRNWMADVEAEAESIGSDRERAEFYGRRSDEQFEYLVGGLDLE